MPVTKLRTRAAALAGTVLRACTTVGPDFQRPQVLRLPIGSASHESLAADLRAHAVASCSSGGARSMILCSNVWLPKRSA